MGETSIEWTHFPGTVGRVWNPSRGCSRVSEGCRHCYAERQAHRFAGPGGPYEGLTKLTKHGPVWTGEARFIPEMLDAPLRWRKPSTVFVNSMSDLFHEKLREHDLDAIISVMANTPRHTYQVLTKRAARMKEVVDDWQRRTQARFPRNVWLGVSVENQAAADERIPLLLETPSACRMVSAEPLLGPLELQDQRGWLEPFQDTDPFLRPTPRINWVIVGGESGPGARPCSVEWATAIRDQCERAGVAFFLKQLGTHAAQHDPWGRYTGKGADLSEWPEDLRVRQFPEVNCG